MLYGSSAYGTVEYAGINTFGETGAITTRPFQAFVMIQNKLPVGKIDQVKPSATINNTKPTL